MLVLSRKENEAIIMYRNGEDVLENIKITVIETSNNRVRIGIEAPDDVVVDRKEVYIKKLENKNDYNGTNKI